MTDLQLLFQLCESTLLDVRDLGWNFACLHDHATHTQPFDMQATQNYKIFVAAWSLIHVPCERPLRGDEARLVPAPAPSAPGLDAILRRPIQAPHFVPVCAAGSCNAILGPCPQQKAVNQAANSSLFDDAVARERQ
jgi:hypothetical protein